MITAKSNRLLEEYGVIVPGGVHSNFRRPIYFREARGAYLWDVDGNQYLDCVVNNGACILGHGDADVTAAVTEAALPEVVHEDRLDRALRAPGRTVAPNPEKGSAHTIVA